MCFLSEPFAFPVCLVFRLGRGLGAGTTRAASQTLSPFAKLRQTLARLRWGVGVFGGEKRWELGPLGGGLVVLWLVVLAGCPRPPTWSPSWMERWRSGGKLNMAADCEVCTRPFLRSTAVRHSKAVKTPRDHEQLARRTLQQHGVCATERLLPSQTKTKMFANLLRTSFFFSAPAVSQREQISSMSNEGRESESKPCRGRKAGRDARLDAPANAGNAYLSDIRIQEERFYFM